MAHKRQPPKKAPPARRQKKPAYPAFVAAVAPLPQRAAAAPSLQDLAELERSFGFTFPTDVRRLMVGLASFELEGGAVNPLTLAQLKQYNALDGRPVPQGGPP